MKKITVVLLCLFVTVQFLVINASATTFHKQAEKLRPKTDIVHDGNLIMSNSPESVKKVGILYSEKLLGRGRLLFHHVNETNDADKKLVITVENLTNVPQMFATHQCGLSKPEYNYLKAGEDVLVNYFNSVTSRIFFLKPNEIKVIYDSTYIGWPVKTVLSGMIDVEAAGSVKITFAMLNEKDGVEKISQLPLLKRGIAPRGTFDCLTICQNIFLDRKGTFYYLIEEDPSKWIKGWDALNHEITINHGNYGIMYRITLIALRDTQVLICPRGGIFQGKVYWEDGELVTVKRPHVFKIIKEPVKIGELKRGEVRTFIYFLPNGSAAPVLIGFKTS